MRVLIIVITGLWLLISQVGLASEPSLEELERWLESDDMMPPSVSTADVNEGELVFLAQHPAKQVHHHQNYLIINADSLRDGWVRLNQCHDHLDRVPRAQIMYNKDRIRDLQIVTSDNIEQNFSVSFPIDQIVSKETQGT